MLNKIVNGEEVICSAEEEAQIRSEWAKNDMLQNVELEKQKEQKNAKKSAVQKLSLLGLNDAEISAILNLDATEIAELKAKVG